MRPITPPPANPVVEMERIIHEKGTEFERTLVPIRKAVWKRHPLVFVCFVSFGVGATFTGIEQLLLSVPFLQMYPIVILGLGVLSLIVTGTVYKKLG